MRKNGGDVDVAYIVKMFPRFSETFILSEILELERSGAKVHIFSLKRPNDPMVHADVARVQASVAYVPMAGVRDALRLVRGNATVFASHPRRYVTVATSAIKRRRWGAVKRFLQAGAIAPALKATGAKHVHAHFASSATSVAHYVQELAGIGYSFTAHAKDIYIDGVAEDVLVRKMSGARFVVTVSEFNREHLGQLLPEARIERIYNGLDLSEFRRDDARESDVPLVLAVGRLVEKKGFADLIRACALLREWGVAFRCEIVGMGEERVRLQALIEELELHGEVRLTGPMPRENLRELYPAASVVVAPCVVGTDGNRDGLPTVLIEAMALEVPVVATPVTGIPELVRQGETGRLVEPSCPHELAWGIRRTLEDREEARRMAAAGRELVERTFDIRQNVAQLASLFQEASAAR